MHGGRMARWTDKRMYVRIQHIRQNLMVFLRSEVYVIEIMSTILNKIMSNQPCSVSVLFKELISYVYYATNCDKHFHQPIKFST